MALQSLHAPYIGSADMWSKDKSISEPALVELLLSLEDCLRYNIPILFAHTWIGFENIPEPTDEGIVIEYVGIFTIISKHMRYKQNLQGV